MVYAITSAWDKWGAFMKTSVRFFIGAALASLSIPAFSTETITYSYDAIGRLVKVVRSGTVNNGVTAEITHDKANNRARVKVTGASR